MSVASGGPPPGSGLCGVCAHVRIVRNRRGSTFLLCGLSATDPAFPKYPPLPVLHCRGFERADDATLEERRDRSD